MPRYRVKQRYLSGLGKKQFKSFDEVSERDFPSNFNQLLKEGRIEVIPETENKVLTLEEQKTEINKRAENRQTTEKGESAKTELNKIVEDSPNALSALKSAFGNDEESEGVEVITDESKPLFVFEPDGEKRPIFSDEDLNKKEVCEHLESLDIDFNKSDKKAVLFDLIPKN